MKLLNKKGFVLVETLIVTAFVMAIFIMVYQNVVPYLGEYEKMTSYDDVDSIYATNLYKQILLHYGNMNYIEEELKTKSYVDISNCEDENIYVDGAYCQKMKTNLSITADDYIFITAYNISSFREEVKNNEFFDSGKLSNFKSYVDKLGDVDSFYDPTDKTQAVSGKYRLFMTRTVTNSDQTTTKKYVNLGIYQGEYAKYNIGDIVTFNPGTDTNQEFYVLKPSKSTEKYVTLIASKNIEGLTTSFNSTNTNASPNSLLTSLKTATSTWTNTYTFTSSDTYTYENGYSINYNGYQARLLDVNDIYSLLGCEEDHLCFDISTHFQTPLTNLSFLYENLEEDASFWLANSLLDGSAYAWSIQNGSISPNEISNNQVGIRPVIVVDKGLLG